MPLFDHEKADMQIQHQVLLELRGNQGVDAAEIGLCVEQGVVTLTGIVGSDADKRGAEIVALRAAGVRDVANHIQVQASDSPTLSDSQLVPAIRQALDREDMEGHNRVVGVKGISNAFTSPAASCTSEDIQRSIAEALGRQADRQARRIRHEATEIQIEVTDGHVLLSGAVATWREKRAVLEAARHVHGVLAVDDNLLIKPVF